MPTPLRTYDQFQTPVEIEFHHLARVMIRHYGAAAAARVLRGDSAFAEGDVRGVLLWAAVVQELRRRRNGWPPPSTA